MTDPPSSRYIVRTVDGLATAIAGFPTDTAIRSDSDLDGFTLGELRALRELPGALEIFIPYRFDETTVITVNVLSREWNGRSER